MLKVGKLEWDYSVEMHKQDGNHCYPLKLFQLCFVSSGSVLFGQGALAYLLNEIAVVETLVFIEVLQFYK